MKERVFIKIISCIIFILPVSFSCQTIPPPQTRATGSTPILGSAELHYLREALRCIKMTPQDLLYKKNQIPDLPYRLKTIDRLMANPIEVPFYTDRLARIISRPQTLPGVIYPLSRQIDLTLPETIFEDKLEPTFREIKDFPPDILVDLLSCMHQSGNLVKEAFADMSEEGKKNLSEKGETFEVYQGYDSVSLGKLISAGCLMSNSVERARRGLKIISSSPRGKSAKEFGLDETRVNGGILFYDKTTVGEVIIGDNGSNEYNDDFALIIDLGGDDKYTGRAGGTDGRTQPPVAVCIDMGGNNEFVARMKPEPVKHEESDKLPTGNDRINFCHGGALAGVGILVVDGDGNNTFQAGDWSQGAAHLGVGILLRSGKGNDLYKGLDCVQGAASFGIGILIDEQGDDKYQATFGSQGFGAPAGLGLLQDKNGHDNYYAGGRYEDFPQRPKNSFIAMSQGFGYGLRPNCSGGIGILMDNAGNDFYYLDNQFGIGGSYWYGFGMFVDDAGDDTYETGKMADQGYLMTFEERKKAITEWNPREDNSSGEYDGYTMGAPIHLAVACMIDRTGNDKYHGNMIGPAVGWDLSPGWLIDGGGTDEFTTSKKWNWMAAGVQNGCGFLIKKSGLVRFDGYNYPGGHQERDCGSIGILLNLGGNGEYVSVNPLMKPGMWSSGISWNNDNRTWCAGIDTTGPAGFTTDGQLDNWPRREVVKPKEEPEPPLEGIDAITPTETVTTLTREELDKLWQDCVREQGAHHEKSSAARDKFKTLGVSALYYAIPKLASDNYYEQNWASTFVTSLGKTAVPVLLEHIKLKDKYLRRMIILNIGNIGDQSATELILPYLNDKNLIDVTCMALGKLKDNRAVPDLLKLSDNKLFQESEGIRKIVAVALGNIGDPEAIPHLIKALDEEYFWVRYPAEKALIQIGEPAVPALLEVLYNARFPAKAHAIEALGRIKDKENRVYHFLLDELNNNDWAIRGLAAEALADYGNPAALTILENLKQSEKHPFVLSKLDWAIKKLTK